MLNGASAEPATGNWGRGGGGGLESGHGYSPGAGVERHAQDANRRNRPWRNFARSR